MKIILLILSLLIATSAAGWECMGEIVDVESFRWSDKVFPINGGTSYSAYIVILDTGKTVRLSDKCVEGTPSIGYFLFRKMWEDGYIYKVKEKR